MINRGVANSPLLIGFHNWVTLGLSSHCKSRFVLKLSIDSDTYVPHAPVWLCCYLYNPRNSQRCFTSKNEIVPTSKENPTPIRDTRKWNLPPTREAVVFCFCFIVKNNLQHQRRMPSAFTKRRLKTYRSSSNFCALEVSIFCNLEYSCKSCKKSFLHSSHQFEYIILKITLHVPDDHPGKDPCHINPVCNCPFVLRFPALQSWGCTCVSVPDPSYVWSLKLPPV